MPNLAPARRRPTALAPWGVVLSVVAVALGGCSGQAVEIHADAQPSPAECAALLDDLPDTLIDQLRRPVAPEGAPGAAWGDPAIVLTCGVGIPAEYDEFSPCLEASGVGWFIPDSATTDPDAEVVLTTIGYEPNIEVRVPSAYRPSGPAAVMTELAEAVRARLRLVKPCH